MDIDYDALRRLFLAESGEALNRMEIALLRLEGAPGDREALADIFARYRPERVVNLAAQAGVRYSLENPAAYIDSNLVGLKSLAPQVRPGA